MVVGKLAGDPGGEQYSSPIAVIIRHPFSRAEEPCAMYAACGVPLDSKDIGIT